MLSAEQIKVRAATLGFDLCGVTAAEAYPELDALSGWLARGFAGRMTSLNRTARLRADIRRWLPTARSVICVACVYHVRRPRAVETRDRGQALIARYARGDDYHDVLQRRLEALLSWMRETAAGPFDARIAVDTAPVQEKVYAARAGLGWIGRHSCLVNPTRGSWLVLGTMATSLALEPDAPGVDRCGSCRLCIEACPTGAIVEPGMVDARRCLSYLTIETRGAIPEEHRADLGSHVFGCDICQDVCPWNASAAPSNDAVWQPRPGLDAPRLIDLWRDSDEGLAARIEGTALRRRGVEGLRRNVAVALGNCGDGLALDALRADTDPRAARSALVAEHVAWAIGRCR